MNTTQTQKTELTEIRPGRNFIRLGDPVRVKPPHGTSFDTTVRRLTQLSDGTVEVEVVDPRFGHFRTVTPERVTRKAKSRQA